MVRMDQSVEGDKLYKNRIPELYSFPAQNCVQYVLLQGENENESLPSGLKIILLVHHLHLFI